MILSQITADNKIRRMAIEIAENNADVTELVIIGIKENGIFIAEKMAFYLKEYFKGIITIVALTVNKKMPSVVTLSTDVELKNKQIILVDDVANSGKTMLYALNPLLAQYPAQIQTMALVERTHKMFPISLNYVGVSVSTNSDQHIVVHVKDGQILGAEVENKFN